MTDPTFLARIPAALGLSRVEITRTRHRSPAAEWNLGAAGPRAVWGLAGTGRRAAARLPDPFNEAYPDLAHLVGLPAAVAEIDAMLGASLDAPRVVTLGAPASGAAAPAPAPAPDAALASALANLREQVLVAIRIGRVTEVPLVRGYIDDDEGSHQVLEEVWLDLGAFVTVSDARIDEWRLQEHWYRCRPRWAFRPNAMIPRREALDAQTVRVLRGHYGLYPRGMHRTLFGSYLLHVAAHLDLVEVSGPPPLARPDEAKAAALLADPNADGFPRAAVHRAMLSDPERALCDRALNGIHAFALGGPRPLVAAVAFSRDTNHVPADAPRRSAGTVLPDIEVVFAPAGSGLAVERITATFGEQRWSAAPSDPVLGLQLLHLARSALLLAGEIDVHLMTHVLAEHVQVALHAALPAHHPVRRLLETHLDGVDVINYAGDWLVLGEEGVISATTPLTAEDLAARTARALAEAWQGFRSFRPRAPLCADDVYARAAGVFWEALDPYVRGMLEGAAVDPDVTGFASMLSDASPLGSDGARVEVAIRDPEDLVQFCRFVVFHATFLHGWVNDAQWDDGGHPDLAPLAPRSLPDGSLPYAVWAAGASPTRVNAAYQRIIANALTRFDVGLALHDDLYPCTPPGFRALVEHLPPPFTDRWPADRRLEKGWIRSRLNS